jgi:hypothetical protein
MKNQLKVAAGRSFRTLPLITLWGQGDLVRKMSKNRQSDAESKFQTKALYPLLKGLGRDKDR